MPLMGDSISTTPTWSPRDVLSIQKELFSLGLYRLNLDGVFGLGTEIALIEAFGGDGWRALTPAELIGELSQATPPMGTRGEHRIRFGALSRDGLLDITVGLGFDEGGSHLTLAPAFDMVLRKHGFTVAPDEAAMLRQRARRPAVAGEPGTLYVRRDALRYTPFVGVARSVDAVVRLVMNDDGVKGAATADAFRDAMSNADVSYYAGHGRYGSGPDFDAAMKLELLDERGAREGDAFDDYERFEEALAHIGAAKGRNAWAEFLDRASKGRVRVTGLNQGNIFLNPVNRHPTEFGGRLMYWNLTRTHGEGAAPMTGTKGALASTTPSIEYRIWVFDGCRTVDYLESIRATPTLSSKQVDLFVTKKITYFSDKAPTLDAFLEGLLAQRSAEQIAMSMDSRNTTLREPGAVVSVEGAADNPIVR